VVWAALPLAAARAGLTATSLPPLR
jgi:hypothetical protein